MLLLTVRSLAQGTFDPLRITFDGPPVLLPGTGYHVQEHFEGGFWFVPIPGFDGFVRRGGGISFYPEDVAAYLQATLGNALWFGRNDGSVFDLASVDLAEYSTVAPNARTVPFVCNRPDGDCEP